jgi:hypothetical protein
MYDKFEGHAPGLNSPPSHLWTVTPDDDHDLPVASRGLNVEVGGSIRVTTIEGDEGTVHVAAGVVFPIRASRIWATGTTATGIAVLY